MDNDRSHHLLMRDEKENDTMDAADDEGSYMDTMKANLGTSNSKILAMKCKAPAASDGNYIQ